MNTRNRRSCELSLLVLFGLTLERVSRRKQLWAGHLLEQERRLAAAQSHAIEGMAVLIESRDGSTGEHVRNTAAYVRLLGEELLRRGMYQKTVDRRYVEVLSRVAPLHDVGKIRVPDAILRKPGPLSKEEYALMRLHTVWGGEIVERILGAEAEPDIADMARLMALYHHERWDGKGYPSGLRGTEIPLCARIMAVADVFDALSSPRVYKEAVEPDRVFEEMAEGAGTRFQPELVQLFLELRPQVEAYAQRSR